MLGRHSWMRTLINKLKLEDDKFNQELEDSHGDFDKMKLVFEKRIDLYGRFLKDDELTDRIDRLTLDNKKEWTMSHLLNLIVEKECNSTSIDESFSSSFTEPKSAHLVLPTYLIPSLQIFEALEALEAHSESLEFRQYSSCH